MADYGEHPLADREAAYSCTHGLDAPGQLQAGRERQGRLLLVAAGDHQTVGEVDAGGRHPDPHAAGTGLRHRQIGQLESVRATQLPADNGSHEFLRP